MTTPIIKVTQMWASIKGDTENRSVDYLVENAPDEEQAMGAVYDAVPSRLPSNPFMVLDNLSVEEIDKKACEADTTVNGVLLGGQQDGTVHDGLYKVTAEYVNQSSPAQGTPPIPEDGQPDLDEEEVRLKQFSFSQSLENVQEYTNQVGPSFFFDKDAGGLPDPNPVRKVRGIHPRGDSGDYEGVSVKRPIGSYVIKYYPSAERATQAYLNSVMEKVGKINETTFYGHEQGEVLFVSAQGSGFNEKNYELQFTFEVRKNKQGQTLEDLDGNTITYDVQGFEYAWVDYEEQIVDDTITRQNPVQVVVESLYETADLNDLFLPPAPAP